MISLGNSSQELYLPDDVETDCKQEKAWVMSVEGRVLVSI